MSNITIKPSEGKYWYSRGSASGKDGLYVGYHASSREYRSRLEFNPSSISWGNTDLTKLRITQAVLELYPRAFYASSVKNADTWIGVSTSLDNTEEAYKNAISEKISDEKPVDGSEHSYRNLATKYIITGDHLSTLETQCKNNQKFSIYIGGVTDVQGVVFTGTNPSASSLNSLTPNLKITYDFISFDGQITTNQGEELSLATLTGENYGGEKCTIIWSIGNEVLQQSDITTFNVINSFSIRNSDSELLYKIFGSNKSSANLNCKVKIDNSTVKEFNFILFAPKKASISLNNTGFIFDSSIDSYLLGYSKPKINIEIESLTGASIAEVNVSINSCGIQYNLVENSGSFLIDNLPALGSYTLPQDFIVNLIITDSRGAKAEVKLTTPCKSVVPPKIISYSPLRKTRNNIVYIEDTIYFDYDKSNDNKISLSINVSPNIDSNNMTIVKNENYYEISFIDPSAGDTTYDLTYTLKDNFTSTIVRTTVVSNEYIMHIKNDGKSLGLGCAAADEDKTITCGWKLILNNGIQGIKEEDLNGLKLGTTLIPKYNSGGLQIGEITKDGEDASSLNIPYASSNSAGVIQIGNSLKVNSDGILTFTTYQTNNTTFGTSGNKIYIGTEESPNINGVQNGDIYFRYEGE